MGTGVTAFNQVAFLFLIPKTTPDGQLLDPGVDLNMQQGLAEHIKDMIILTSATQGLSIISNYLWLLLLGAPVR